jgi:hypothetical protein
VFALATALPVRQQCHYNVDGTAACHEEAPRKNTKLHANAPAFHSARVEYLLIGGYAVGYVSA